MNREQFSELLAAVERLADTADVIVRILDLYVRNEKDPHRHSVYLRLINSLRDCSLASRHALADAPMSLS